MSAEISSYHNPLIADYRRFHEERKERKRTFGEEIAYLRTNYRKEGLPVDWYRMPATGFMVGAQVDLLFKNLNPDSASAETLRQKQKWLEQTDADIKGFIIEYLTEKLVFPIHYTILPEEGRIVDKLYGNKDIESIVLESERNGSVKRSIGRVKDFFLHAPDNSIAVMTSPAGWSGLKMENGEDIVYPDSQTYIWKKEGNDIWGFTVKTDFTLAEHRELLKRLSGKELPQDATVTDYVEAVAGILPKPGEKQDIKDIVDVMRDVRFDSTGGSLYAFEKRMWKEVYKDLERRDELCQYDEKTQEIVDGFKEYVLSNDLTRQETQEAVSLMVLRVARFIRGEQRVQKQTSHIKGSDGKDHEVYKRAQVNMNSRYGDVLKDVQEVGGCAGGGGNGKKAIADKLKYIIQSIAPRKLVERKKITDPEEWFSCPKCQYKADGPIGNTCPGCDLTKEEYAKETGVVCD